MVLEKAIAMGLELLLNDPKGTGIAAVLIVVGFHVQGAADLAKYFQFAGYGLILLALGLLFGVVDLSSGLLGLLPLS
ncbi:hypothetical protein [Halosimplex amylolyticum]|uniref:hypothetical protein n=1 Tax=Halosimplex amylolyticum TaxID=3396616 RepID=UPI003F54569E